MISLNLTIVITVINFAVLYWLFKKYLLSLVVEFLDRRAEEIATTRSETRSDRAKAEELLDETRDRLRNARIEAGDLIKEAKLDGVKEQSKIIARAKEEVEKMNERAREEIVKKVEEARAKLKGEVAGISIDIAEKLLERSVNAQDHERAVTEFLDKMEEEK